MKPRRACFARPTFVDMMKAFGPVDAMLARLAEGWMQLDLDPVRKIVARLRYSTPIPPELVAQAQAVADQCKRAYRRMDLHEVGSVVKTQLIVNEAEQQGLTENAA